MKKDKEERNARLAQQVDFQRIMRERKTVGFKPIQMVEKPISPVLQKIRQRKLEVSKKSVNVSAKEIVVDVREEDDGVTLDFKSFSQTSKVEAPVEEASDDKPCSSDEITPSNNNILVEETDKSFRPPVDDTQDLFSDFEASEFQEFPSNEKSRSPVEDLSPSLPSLNLRLDSALPDDISSDEEESDKNNDHLPKSLRKHEFSAASVTVNEFLDEEALEDDSDNDLLDSEDMDEENDADMEEHCDYIATDFKEKPIDLERRNQLHQSWLQKQDDYGTEKLLQKLNYGTKQAQDEDEDEKENDTGSEDEEGESESEDNVVKTSTRVTTKMLKQMIPLMFTDKDDGFVSSEDEAAARLERTVKKDEKTERSLSRQRSRRKMELELKKKLMSAAQDDNNEEVFGRIRKINSAPETKKAKTQSFFAQLTKGSSMNPDKSSFLRRASNHPVPSSHRQGPSRVKSFVFGRDDSRSSTPITEESRALNQTEGQMKKIAPAKFSGSQAKRSTQETQTRNENVAGTSLFDILKRSSLQTGQDAAENMFDHQAVFASFK